MEDHTGADIGDMFTDALLDLITGLGFERFADMRELLQEDPLAGESLLLYLEDTENAARYLRMHLSKVQNQLSNGSHPTLTSLLPLCKETKQITQQPINQVKTDCTQQSDTYNELTGQQHDISINTTKN